MIQQLSSTVVLGTRICKEMSFPSKEKCGIELSSWNASYSGAGVPIKKRRFLFTCSPSSPPSCPTAGSPDNGDIQMEEATAVAVESSTFRIAAQVPDADCFRELSMDSRANDVAGRQVNLAQDCGSHHSYSEGPLSTLNVNVSTELGNGGKIICENGPTVRAVRTVPGPIEFRSAPMDVNSGNKLILSEKSAFQRVLANTELPLPLNMQCEPSSSDQSSLVSSAGEGEPSSCKLALTLSESRSVSRTKEVECGLEFNHDNQHTSRSHWDLNTTMDTWETSSIATTTDEGDGGDNKVGFRFIHCSRPGTEQINRNIQESTVIHSLAMKYDLSENTCNPQLSNTLQSANEKSSLNTNLNLQLNIAFGSMPISTVSMPFAPTTPCLHKASDLSLSAVWPTSTHLNLVASGDVKTEPVEDVGNGEYTGTSNFKALNCNIVKSEALDIVQQGCSKVTSPNGLETACEGDVKIEQLEVSSLEGPRKPEMKAHNCECSIDALETVKPGEAHDGKEENADWSSVVSAQGVVDSNKMPDTLSTPSVDASCTMEGHVSKVAPVTIGAKTLVLTDTKLDLSEDIPSNFDQSHGASPTLDSSVISKAVVSDTNDSHNPHSTSMHVVPHDDEKDIAKASEVPFETRVVVSNELSQAKGANEVACTSDVQSDSRNKEQGYANCIQGSASYLDSDMQLPAFFLMDVHASDYNNVTECYAREETKKPDLNEIENEPCGSNVTVSDKERVPKQHTDDDDYEDGELRESLLRDGFKGNTKEKKDVSIKEVVKSDTLEMSTTVPQHGIKLQTIEEAKDVHCAVESEVQLCPKKTLDDLSVRESLAIEKLTTESSKKKALKISTKISQDLGKENSKSKPTHKKLFSSSHGKSPEKPSTDLSSQQPKAPAYQNGASKTNALQAFDASKQVKDRSDRSHIMHSSSPCHVSSGRIKALHSKSSSRSERERIKDKSVRREKVYMRSSRDDTHIRRMYRSEKEKDLEQAFRKGGSDRVPMRGRIIQQYGDWDPGHGYASEHYDMSTSSQYSRPKNASEVTFTVGVDGMFGSAGRTGKKHVDDELCRPPSRRLSPGGSGSLPAGVQMVRRTMRDISPGRCTEEGIPHNVMLNHEGKIMRGFADDMDSSPMLLRTRPHYEPGRNCLIRRERSLSPFQKRVAPHVSNISFASSTRRRARSPHMWSPSRRPPEVFDRQPDLIRSRSPDLRVERVRSPGDRACFQDNMLGRRHISHIAQLHGEMSDVNLMRSHDLTKVARRPQGNLRRFDLIDHRDNFLQPSQFHGIEGDNAYAEERRNSDEGLGVARSFRQQHYAVGDDAGNDGAFLHRVEDISPRSFRLCQDEDEEFPGRGISRGGSIRNRLGNAHDRELRDMDEQEDNYRQDEGRGWRGASFKDARLKRRF